MLPMKKLKTLMFSKLFSKYKNTKIKRIIIIIIIMIIIMIINSKYIINKKWKNNE